MCAKRSAQEEKAERKASRGQNIKTTRKRTARLAVGATSDGHGATPTLGNGAGEEVFGASADAGAGLPRGDAGDVGGQGGGALRISAVAFDELEGASAELAQVGRDDGRELGCQPPSAARGSQSRDPR